ncbi:PREDICTED: CDP-diacylglycerol--serine O-phosphatidyltransferase 1 isoform X2 [Tarenaya hassleriana]|uniref:CDP-diacylglycerol--serine O-phosphatidyltransferase 1 isoform X2 n=1 Tax=Tarenaya hassleriana TaxID=28532 RepID=UPI00053C1E02|nr:PREDICTED: CDP-diacylglycerol--serine O-phosphatidyltransferase 1 isoform X2 [Tarenaya hassleriana]
MEPNGHKRPERGKEHFGRVNGGDVLTTLEDDLDPWTAWAYKPRTISLLLIGACFMIWASGALDPESTTSDDLVTSVKRGVWAMIAVFLAYCLLQAPSTVLIRPHPAIWRLVHGMAVIYLVTLTFLLFQKRDDARQFMKFLHHDLGIELPERSYGADCRIYVPDHPTNRFKNLYDTVFDEFVLAHIFGWWGKAILIRNQPLLWVLSIGFELLEVKRTLGQFTPAHWDKDEWHPLQGPWRFVQVLSLCIVFLTVELNTFFLKFCLWIPPGNPVIIYRLILWWLIAIPTIREYNSYLQDRKPVKKVGAFCWLSLAICIVELLICIKFGHGLYPKQMPVTLVTFWACVGVGLVAFLIVWSWNIHTTLDRKRR